MHTIEVAEQVHAGNEYDRLVEYLAARQRENGEGTPKDAGMHIAVVAAALLVLGDPAFDPQEVLREAGRLAQMTPEENRKQGLVVPHIEVTR